MDQKMNQMLDSKNPGCRFPVDMELLVFFSFFPKTENNEICDE